MITPSFSSFSVVFTSQRCSNCSITVDIGFVKLSSDYFCGNAVFKMNIEFAAIVCDFLDTFLFNVRRSLSLNFGFRPRFLLADDVFP